MINTLIKATCEERAYYFASQFEDVVCQDREIHVVGAWSIGYIGSSVKKNKMINVCVYLTFCCLCSP